MIIFLIVTGCNIPIKIANLWFMDEPKFSQNVHALSSMNLPALELRTSLNSLPTAKITKLVIYTCFAGHGMISGHSMMILHAWNHIAANKSPWSRTGVKEIASVLPLEQFLSASLTRWAGSRSAFLRDYHCGSIYKHYEHNAIQSVLVLLLSGFWSEGVSDCGLELASETWADAVS